MSAVTDYRGQHQPTRPDGEYGAWLCELTPMCPDDVYNHPEWYTGFRQWVGPVAATLRAVRGNPDARVTVYRAVPAGVETINPGDWVTLTPQYAELHAESNGDEAWHVVSAEVRAGDVSFGGDDLMEWGWWPGGV